MGFGIVSAGNPDLSAAVTRGIEAGPRLDGRIVGSPKWIVPFEPVSTSVIPLSSQADFSRRDAPASKPQLENNAVQESMNGLVRSDKTRTVLAQFGGPE
ncbi:MAG: hypothetical protein LAQ69_23580 [Acidobacteriia bacterium]|nr:hypothetical protein [Terriglobia bacterium]